MELKKYFTAVMKESVNMALATSVDNGPNVRVVTYGWDEAAPGTLYFCTFKGCQKIEEFKGNAQVACLPLPQGPEAEDQVRIFGEVKPSALTLEQLIALIAPKAPDGADTLRDGGEMLELYEVSFTEAWVTHCMNPAQLYKL